MSATYTQDFYAWAMEQADWLKSDDFARLDTQNLAEEIADMGRSELRQLQSRFEVLLMHLIKYHYQPQRRSRSWHNTIKEQRKRLGLLLKNSPSLKNQMVQDDFLSDLWEIAILSAMNETHDLKDLLPEDTFAEHCPWTLEQIMDDQFYPE